MGVLMKHRLYLSMDLKPTVSWDSLVDHVEPLLREIDPRLDGEAIKNHPYVAGSRSYAGREFLMILRSPPSPSSREDETSLWTLETSGEVSLAYLDKVTDLLVYLNPMVARPGQSCLYNMDVLYGSPGHRHTLVWGATEADRVAVLIPNFWAAGSRLPEEGLLPAYRGYAHDAQALEERAWHIHDSIQKALQAAHASVVHKVRRDTLKAPLCLEAAVSSEACEPESCEGFGPR